MVAAMEADAFGVGKRAILWREIGRAHRAAMEADAFGVGKLGAETATAGHGLAAMEADAFGVGKWSPRRFLTSRS